MLNNYHEMINEIVNFPFIEWIALGTVLFCYFLAGVTLAYLTKQPLKPVARERVFDIFVFVLLTQVFGAMFYVRDFLFESWANESVKEVGLLLPSTGAAWFVMMVFPLLILYGWEKRDRIREKLLISKRSIGRSS
jgi:hypothetical protein